MLTEDDLHALLPELETFHARFGRFFPRSESRAWSRKYLTGLLLSVGRKNVENLAEQVGGHRRRLLPVRQQPRSPDATPAGIDMTLMLGQNLVARTSTPRFVSHRGSSAASARWAGM